MAQESSPTQEYVSQLDPKRKDMFQKVRAVIFEEVPEIKETMKYRMPTYELDEVVVAVASQKHYMSLYMDTKLVAKYGDELSHLNCGQSCVRFRNIDELPLETVRKIIRETVDKQS